MSRDRWVRVRSPFFFDRRNDRDHGVVSVTADIDTAIVVMAVHRTWNRHLVRDAFLGFKKCLTEHPAALIIDLRALADPHADSVNTWITAGHIAAAMDPPVQVLVCLAADTMLADRLRRLGALRLLPMFASVAQARAAALNRLPLTERFRLRLAAHPDAPALARTMITDACAAWQLPTLLHPGRLIISELTANAAQHACTPITVIASRRAAGLHLAVADGDPRLPRLLRRQPASTSTAAPAGPLYPEPGAGLRLVDAAATRWGALPTIDGKVVWATLHTRDAPA